MQLLLAKEKELHGLKLGFMGRKAEEKVEWLKRLSPERIGLLDRIRHHSR